MRRRMTGEESIDPTRRVNNSLAFLFVLGCEIEITWLGVKESSSQASRGIGSRRELFSPRIFISSPGHLLFGLRWAKGARNTSFSRSCGLSIFLFCWNRDCCVCVRSREWRISGVFREVAVRLQTLSIVARTFALLIVSNYISIIIFFISLKKLKKKFFF